MPVPDTPAGVEDVLSSTAAERVRFCRTRQGTSRLSPEGLAIPSRSPVEFRATTDDFGGLGYDGASPFCVVGVASRCQAGPCFDRRGQRHGAADSSKHQWKVAPGRLSHPCREPSWLSTGVADPPVGGESRAGGAWQAGRSACASGVAGEHVLLEDVPGVGKTLIARPWLGCVGHFPPHQFTPDLLPADITGSSYYNAKGVISSSARAVFANIVWRTKSTDDARTQGLVGSDERRQSRSTATHLLERPFMVIATQNPLEFEGTYPLPESQLDRFLMRISVGYPERDQELRVLVDHRAGEPVDRLEAVLTGRQVEELQDEVRRVRVDDSINEYLLDVVHATRTTEDLQVGVSIRGALSYYRACQALAMAEGRDYVVPDDVKRLAVPILSHRVLTKGYLHGSQREALEALIGRLVEEVPVPS